VNLDRMRSAVGQRVRLRPGAIELDTDGFGVWSQDDDWVVDSIYDEVIRIRNTRTGHCADLGKDHIHHYTSDPQPSRQSGVAHGFLTLTVQLYLHGLNVSIAPTSKLGEPVPKPRPETAELQVDLSYPRDAGLQARLEQQGFRIAWVRRSRVQRLLHLEGWQHVVDHGPDGQLVKYCVKERLEDLVLLKKPR
jgi:hypothetical protein